MINMMFIEDYIIELGEKYGLSVEDALNVYDELAEELGRQPNEAELEEGISTSVYLYA